MAVSSVLHAATWHVDLARGDDANVGDAAAPFRTLSQVVKLVNPGDTVLVNPGVYFEQVKLERGGTAEAPITFRAVDGLEKTIVTGAHRPLREGRLKWESVAGGLWRVALPEDPATLLCDELNLYRYPSREELQTGVVKDVSVSKMPGPGPKHGRDGMHPDDEGHRLVANLLIDHLSAADPRFARKPHTVWTPSGDVNQVNPNATDITHDTPAAAVLGPALVKLPDGAVMSVYSTPTSYAGKAGQCYIAGRITRDGGKAWEPERELTRLPQGRAAQRSLDGTQPRRRPDVERAADDL